MDVWEYLQNIKNVALRNSEYENEIRQLSQKIELPESPDKMKEIHEHHLGLGIYLGIWGLFEIFFGFLSTSLISRYAEKIINSTVSTTSTSTFGQYAYDMYITTFDALRNLINIIHNISAGQSSLYSIDPGCIYRVHIIFPIGIIIVIPFSVLAVLLFYGIVRIRNKKIRKLIEKNQLDSEIECHNAELENQIDILKQNQIALLQSLDDFPLAYLNPQTIDFVAAQLQSGRSENLLQALVQYEIRIAQLGN